MTPTAEKINNGPIMSTLRYWLKRWARRRALLTRQTKLKACSIFCSKVMTVYIRSPRPSAPSTPTLMLLTKPITWSVISTPFSPSGASSASNAGRTWLCTPNPLSTENDSASSGTSESSVVYTRLMARKVSWPSPRSRPTAYTVRSASTSRRRSVETAPRSSPQRKSWERWVIW